MVLPLGERLDKSWIVVSGDGQELETQEEALGALLQEKADFTLCLETTKSERQFLYFRSIAKELSKKTAKVWVTSSLEELTQVTHSAVQVFERVDWNTPKTVKVAVQSAIDKLYCYNLIDGDSHGKYIDEVEEAAENSFHLSPFFMAWNEARDNTLKNCDLELKNRMVMLRGCGALAFLGGISLACQLAFPRQERSLAQDIELRVWSFITAPLGLVFLCRSVFYYTFLPSAIQKSTPPRLGFTEEDFQKI